MMLNEQKDSRRNPRSVVHGNVEVNGGGPYRGGKLHDMSVGGASVLYPEGSQAQDNPVQVDDEILLVIRGRAKVPGRVARVFDGGFAVAFDWSLNIEHDRFLKDRDN
ncbi:PilZ domain-containing protein [Thalassospiraceae bacterium LMO-SO8]|nr:PilZ domain-containing protein [Alphaproteobacteria bacterium LMO-S08]WND74589.1 PilZ domain-containing protein [Thalassospiraceae bacterium LMO-SO8]